MDIPRGEDYPPDRKGKIYIGMTGCSEPNDLIKKRKSCEKAPQTTRLGECTF